MSYAYGLNGNDIDWEAIESMAGIYEYCMECDKAIHAIKQSVKDVLNSSNHKFDDESIEQILDLVEERFTFDNECEGHRRCYYYHSGSSFTIAHIIAAGGIQKLAMWGIIHDTNGNFVSTFGKVPDKIFTTDYLEERDEANEWF